MPPEVLEKTPSVEEVLREISRIKTVVTEAVEDGVKSAMKTIKQGRHAVEDVIDDARHTVKQKPFEAMGVVLAAGILTGAFLTWICSRRN